MINARSFTKDWLLKVNKDLGWNRQETQLKNLEKAIAALHLLELLADAKLPFIFKGGTSLFLLMQKIYRLSVDVDIIVEEPLGDADKLFKQICSKSGLFTHFEEQERGSDKAFDIKHYKFFYQPFADDTENSYILLDLYRSSNPYAKTLELELVSEILDTQGKNVTVRVPSIDAILGDKLTAFAPDTIGIPLSAEPGHRPKRIEVLKQLFDIGNLFDLAENMDVIYSTYHTIAEHEIVARGFAISVDDVLRDSVRHAYIIGHGGKVERVVYDSIARGYRDFSRFVVDLDFDESRAVLAAAKVAYIVNVLRSGRMLEKYDDEIDMGNWQIEEKSMLDFNEYKYSNPEAFFYWYMAALLHKFS